VKLPRDIPGREFAALLRPFGYEVVRQTGSHIRLVSTARGHQHHVTIPDHAALRVGTLNSVLGDVASYLERDKSSLIEELFGR
jgi:predicted RNA binding protein YcfA (HicA-like mRNA interferase family)